MSCGGTWILSLRKLQYGTWWIGAASGRAMLTRRVSKPRPDPIYPAYVVGDSDSISETTRVAVVTRPRSGPDQLEDLLPRLLMAVDTTAPIPEVPPVEKLLQRLVTETQSLTVAGRKSSGVGGIRADATVVPIWTAADAAAPSTATHPTGLERRGVFLMWEVGSCCDSVPELG